MRARRFEHDASFDAFVIDAGSGLLRLAHVLTGDRHLAEDLTQETLIRVGLAWRRIRADENPIGYANRTMINAFLNSRRRRRPELRGDNADYEPAIVDPALHHLEDLEDIRARLATLPPQQRAAVAMRFLLDLPDAAIAHALGCGEGAVRSHISRGLSALRRAASVSPAEDPT